MVLVNDEIMYVGDLKNGMTIPISKELDLRIFESRLEVIESTENLIMLHFSRVETPIFEYWFEENDDGEKYTVLYNVSGVKYSGGHKDVKMFLKNEYDIDVKIANYDGRKLEGTFKFTITDINGTVEANVKEFGTVISLGDYLKVRITDPVTFDILQAVYFKNPDGVIVDYSSAQPSNMIFIRRCYSLRDLARKLRDEFSAELVYARKGVEVVEE